MAFRKGNIVSLDLAVKRAKKFYTYYKLSLPVPIESILSKYADVSEENLPVSGDAICINKYDRPKIIIKNNMSELRKRFTYAHELAHLQIPSHIGMISCNTDVENEIDVNAYRTMEIEANMFASEILMPEEWIIGLFKEKAQLQELIDSVCDKANVSFMAASYRIVKTSPINYTYFIYNKIGDYNHVKCGQDSVRPLLLYDKNDKYDTEWIRYNSELMDEANDDTMKITRVAFKNVFSDVELSNIANHFINKDKCDDFIKNILSKTNISYAHLLTMLKSYLPAGFIIEIFFKTSKTIKYMWSDNTYIYLPFKDRHKNNNWLDNNAEYFVYGENDNLYLKIWFFKTPSIYIPNFKNTNDSKSILTNIIDNHTFATKEQRRSVFGQINGVIGSLNNNKERYTEEEFCNTLYQKLCFKEALKHVIEHEDFISFLNQKTKELYNK